MCLGPVDHYTLIISWNEIASASARAANCNPCSPTNPIVGGFPNRGTIWRSEPNSNPRSLITQVVCSSHIGTDVIALNDVINRVTADNENAFTVCRYDISRVRSDSSDYVISSFYDSDALTKVAQRFVPWDIRTYIISNHNIIVCKLDRYSCSTCNTITWYDVAFLWCSSTDYVVCYRSEQETLGYKYAIATVSQRYLARDISSNVVIIHYVMATQ